MSDERHDAADLAVSRVWAGDRGRPRYLHTGAPGLSWSTATTRQGWRQAAAVCELRRDGITTAHRVDGDTSLRVPWPFAALTDYDSADVRVSVVGVDGSSSAPSEWIHLETGPLSGRDWAASFIEAPQKRPDRGTARFRRVLDVPADVVSATVSATAHGLYELVVNGVVVGDEVLTPGWTSYDALLAFQTFDITDLLTPGTPAVLGATVAEGWFGERYGFSGQATRRWLGELALCAQVRLTHADGRVSVVGTDASWQAGVAGPTTSASIYQGEVYDSRLEDQAFKDPDLSLPDAREALVVAGSLDRLVPAWSPPVRTHEHLAVQQVITSPSGATILDFGQNVVGWLRLLADGPAGTTITLRHAEVLEHGELGTRPLRLAAATDRWTLAGTGPQEWSPTFTFHGFRYAEVTGWPGEFDAESVTAVVVHSDMVRTGTLETGDELLDQLHRNVVWGMRGNFVALPTDCPQRDERLGWTGDIQVFSPTASYLYDTTAFLGSWLRDLAVEQARNDGVVPHVVPDVLPGRPTPAAAWGDAATVVPTVLWQHFGDRDVLERQFESMRAWVDAIHRRTGDDLLWTGGMQYGDWLDPSAPPDDPFAAQCDPDIVATAYFARSAQLVADAAAVLGRTAEADAYGDLAARVRAAFADAFVTPSGRMMSDAQTAYALAVEFGLVEGQVADGAGARLAELVRASGYRISTGFVGTPLLLDVLTDTGRLDTAYRMLQQTENPSWLYPVTMGATTVWERWDSMLPDGSINPGEMTSFNHYALGAVADWMHRRIGGIAPAEPGYQVIDVAPLPGGRIRAARASLDTGYGTVAVAWRWADDVFHLELTVPPNTTARVRMPSDDTVVHLGSGRHELDSHLPEPSAQPAPLGLDSTMAAVIDDEAAHRALMAALTEVAYPFAEQWSAQRRWRSDLTVREALTMASDAQVAAAGEALARTKELM